MVTIINMDYGQYISTIALVAVGAGYIFTQWKMGSNKAGADVIVAYREQVALQDKKIIDLTHQVGTLTGQLEEKDKRIDLLQELARGNTPELQEFMKKMMATSSNAEIYMKNTAETLKNMEKFMEAVQKQLVLLQKEN